MQETNTSMLFAPELFSDNDNTIPQGNNPPEWKILIVDDETDVHAITKLSLNGFTFENKRLDLHHAFSAKEAKERLFQHTDFSIVLLDVVMETSLAGLEVVKYIREELKNLIIRIILRTGQPGIAPENEIVANYDINDYQTKAELTENRLFTIIMSCLRAFNSLKTIDSYNKQLEIIVNERTEEVRMKNLEIFQSIRYAQNIQQALLPEIESINCLFEDCFVLYIPKDIVSGDFYWVKQIDNHVVLVAADCTGHGVPGAFMSMLGISFLNDIVLRENILDPNMILSSVRKRVIQSLKQTGKPLEAMDGMDMSVCLINKHDKTVSFSGAYSKILVVKQDADGHSSADFLKGNLLPLGIHIKEAVDYDVHTIKLSAGDALYLFSDGYYDQIGGDNNKKYSSKRFKDLLHDIYTKPMDMQKQILESTHIGWTNNKGQVDDIMVIGVKI